MNWHTDATLTRWYEATLARLREYDNHEVQHALGVLVDHRSDSANSKIHELDNEMLCAAADVRDERRKMAREIDAATNPFVVVGLTFEDDGD